MRIKGPPVSCGGISGSDGLAVTGNGCAWMCVCRRATHRARTWPPLLLFHMAFISPVTLEWYFFLIVLSSSLSPDENVPGLKQCLLPKEGAFVSSPSPPLLSFAPSCFMLLPTKLIKINMFLFASIGVACNLADGGVLLEGQQLHTSGSALGKSAWKKTQAQHTHT